MKCDSCIHLRYFPAGSWYAVAEGCGDVYGEVVCMKGHWEGSRDSDETDDPWHFCIDYEPIVKDPNYGKKA